MTRKALGRGLGALIHGAPGPGEGNDPADASIPVDPTDASAGTASEAIRGERVLEIPLNCIVPNPKQPRIEFAEEPLAELAESIRAHVEWARAIHFPATPCAPSSATRGSCRRRSPRAKRRA